MKTGADRARRTGRYEVIRAAQSCSDYVERPVVVSDGAEYNRHEQKANTVYLARCTCTVGHESFKQEQIVALPPGRYAPHTPGPY